MKKELFLTIVLIFIVFIIGCSKDKEQNSGSSSSPVKGKIDCCIFIKKINPGTTTTLKAREILGNPGNEIIEGSSTIWEYPAKVLEKGGKISSAKLYFSDTGKTNPVLLKVTINDVNLFDYMLKDLCKCNKK